MNVLSKLFDRKRKYHSIKIEYQNIAALLSEYYGVDYGIVYSNRTTITFYAIWLNNYEAYPDLNLDITTDEIYIVFPKNKRTFRASSFGFCAAKPLTTLPDALQHIHLHKETH